MCTRPVIRRAGMRMYICKAYGTKTYGLFAKEFNDVRGLLKKLVREGAPEAPKADKGEGNRDVEQHI